MPVMKQAGTVGTKNTNFYKETADIEAVPKVKFSAASRRIAANNFIFKVIYLSLGK
jgi:hypothetical protein